MKLLVRKPGTGYLDTGLWVPKSAINVEGTKRALTFEFFDKSRVTILTLYKEAADHLVVPREFWQPSDFQFPVVDCRPKRYPKAVFQSRIKLDHEYEGGQLRPTGGVVQAEAMAVLTQTRGGILQLACGLGKSVVALEFIVRRGFPAIIIVDTTQLVKQWREEIETHLDVPDGVGMIGDGEFNWQKSIVIATYHSLAQKAHLLTEEVRRWFGTIIWDEAHHVAAPTFSRSADLFYGLRLGLTATPDREDGHHVIYNFHLGPVLYKNLKQDLKPRIYFVWTGVSLNKEDPRVLAAVNDKNGELHIGKVAGFLGGERTRIDFLLTQVRLAVASNRKVIVLSKSVDALVNMMAAWNDPQQQLITDVPFPTAQEVGEAVPPAELDDRALARVQASLFKLINEIPQMQPGPKAQEAVTKKALFEQALAAHAVYKKCESLWNKRRAEYLKALLAQPTSAGLMIYKVDPDTRSAMLKSKQVTFAISKYGREGLNERSLDTIIVNEPLSSRNSLQQLMGRVLRKKVGKQEPVVVFLEDDIGPFIGMCRKLRAHLNEWPNDEGGPLSYETLGHPISRRQRTWNNTRTAMFENTTSIRGPGS